MTAGLTASFRAVLAALDARGVRFLVIGGYAIAAHGHVRYTKDLDLWVERSDDNAARIVAALEAAGFAGLGLGPADFTTDQVVELGYPPVMIDVTTVGPGGAFAPTHDRRATATIDGVALPVIDRDSLLAVLRASPRASNATDARALAAAAPGASLADGILAAEALRRRAIDDAGDPDRPIARAVRRRTIS